MSHCYTEAKQQFANHTLEELSNVGALKLQIDGRVASPGKVLLPLGQHTISAAKEGYRQQELQITVFPDVQPKVKIKLKDCSWRGTMVDVIRPAVSRRGRSPSAK